MRRAPHEGVCAKCGGTFTHFSVQEEGSMLLTKAFARRILAISPLVAGAAFLALAAFIPSTAMAQRTLTIYHDSVSFPGTDPNINPFNSSHTVAGQLSGVCIEDPSVEPPDIDPAEGLACLADGDCGDADEICDLSGVGNVGVAFRI